MTSACVRGSRPSHSRKSQIRGVSVSMTPPIMGVKTTILQYIERRSAIYFGYGLAGLDQGDRLRALALAGTRRRLWCRALRNPTGRWCFFSRSAKASSARSWKLLPSSAPSNSIASSTMVSRWTRLPGMGSALARGSLALGHFLAFCARFRQADGDGLLAALHRAAFATLAALQLAGLAPFHRMLDIFAGALRIFCHGQASRAPGPNAGLEPA